MVSAGDILAGRYRIDAPLGAGGMATVHRARDLLLGRDVAVKILAPNIAAVPTVLERFGREARALAALNHPNIVAVYDVGWADEHARSGPFLVMELVPGGTLAEHVATHGSLAPLAVADIVDGLASALAALHGAGIVHRDVKPQNVLLSATGPKLADLGVVRLEDEAEEAALTASGETLGTLRFLAPEVLYGQTADPRADAYSLAMVAFEALTGRSPRPALTVGELVDSAWRPPPLVSEARPDLGTRFDSAFAAGLDLDPNRRLDVVAFASALRAAAEGAGSPPVAASPPVAGFPTVAGAALSAPPAVRSAAVADDDPTVLVRTPIASSRTARRGAPQRDRPVSGARLPAVLGIAAVVVAAGVLLALNPHLLAGGGTPTSSAATARPATEPTNASLPATQSPSPPLEPSPAPTATPTLVPSTAPGPDSLDAALTEMRTAITLARGGGGLKGGDAKDLEKAVDEIQRAALKGDLDGAASLARDLAVRVDRLIDKAKIEDAAAERLRTASRNLVLLLEGG